MYIFKLNMMLGKIVEQLNPIKSYRDKEKYSTRAESKTEGMAKLLAESELESMKIWLSIYILRHD